MGELIIFASCEQGFVGKLVKVEDGKYGGGGGWWEELDWVLIGIFVFVGVSKSGQDPEGGCGTGKGGNSSDEQFHWCHCNWGFGQVHPRTEGYG